MTPRLIDSHAHLDLLKNPEAALDLARESGVVQTVTIGIDLETSRKAAAFAARHEDVFHTLGLHPHDAAQATPELWPTFRELALETKPVAIGECGLDYFRNRSPKEQQAEAFARQIELARELGIPLVIHDRDAHRQMLDMLKGYHAEQVGGVVHCFSGDWQVAREALDLGFYLGVTGIVTFPKSDDLRDVVRKAPLDRLLVETDCPYLAPVPFRGKDNQPAYVVHTAKAAAQCRGLGFGDFARATTENCRRLFGLPDVEA